VIRLRPLARLVALAALLHGSAPALAAGLAVRADELHVGSGRVLRDAVLLVEDGRVRALGLAADVRVPEGWPERRAVAAIPGLVASVVAGAPADTRSADATRLAVDLGGALDEPGPWLSAGVTAVAITPGSQRLVAGRGGVLRLTPDRAARTHVRLGPPCAALLPAALDPPALFEPSAPVNVDLPLRPAQPQRPHAMSSAVTELRRLVETGRAGSGDAAWQEVASRRLPLRVIAHRAEDVARAVALAREAGIDLVVEGATEAWKVAGDLAAVDATVILSVPQPGMRPRPAQPGLDARADAVAVLAAAGVEVGLAAEDWGPAPRPLLLAGAAVRAGLDEASALAAVTRVPARAMGAADLGVLRPGGPADLVALTAPPMSLAAEPAFVIVAGRVVHERPDVTAPADGGDLLAVRAGTIHTASAVIRDGVILARDGVVAGVGAGTAMPGAAETRAYGATSVIVPGLVDAFSLAGLEAGATPQGSARTRSVSAIERDEPSLRQALASGVTAFLAVPATSGTVLGSASLVSTALSDPPEPPRGALPAEPELEVISADVGLVLFLDGGPADDAPRAPRLEALKGQLNKAKGYHEKWERWEKRDEKKGDEKGKKAAAKPKKPPEEPRPDPALDPFRPLFQGKARAFLRAGRADSILAGLDALKESGVQQVVLVGGEEADLVSSELASRKVAVVLGPGALRRHEGRVLNVAAELREAGVSVAFGSFAPGGAPLLALQAASAVRDGLSAQDARAAVTYSAVEAAGGPERLGRLARGDRADFVVFSGDPFEPTSRVLLVVVRGRMAWEEGQDASGFGP
jgi:imidazolonepropionase-like amidohydrolase